MFSFGISFKKTNHTHEFVKTLIVCACRKEEQHELRRVFNFLDIDCDGFVTLEDMKRVMEGDLDMSAPAKTLRSGCVLSEGNPS